MTNIEAEIRKSRWIRLVRYLLSWWSRILYTNALMKMGIFLLMRYFLAKQKH